MSIKIVAVGDGTVGKTSLLNTFVTGEFPEDYVPTVFDNQMTNLEVNGKQIQVELWDTAGQEAFDRIRHLSYRDTDIFLIVFCVVNEESLGNVQHKWVPEIKNHYDQTHDTEQPMIYLVGTKSDLRQDGVSQCSTSKIEQTRKAIGAVAYMETS